MAYLNQVLHAATPIGCGRRNGIDWPCGVMVVSRAPGATLRDAFVITTRETSAFADGALVAHSACSLPRRAAALRRAMNHAAGGMLRYRNVHAFGVAHQAHRAEQSDDALVAMIGAVAFPASPALLDAIGNDALVPTHRYIFFRMP